MGTPNDAHAPKALPQVNLSRCTGCGRCVAVCAPHALSLQTQGWKKFATLHNATGCTGCADCLRICPFHAIRMLKGSTAPTAPG